jgi:hypothetical protein
MLMELGDVDEDALGELILRKAEELGMVIVPPEREEPYTVAEAAEALNVSIDTIYAEIKAEKLPAVPRMSVKRVPAWAIRVRQEGGDPMKELARRQKEKRPGFS